MNTELGREGVGGESRQDHQPHYPQRHRDAVPGFLPPSESSAPATMPKRIQLKRTKGWKMPLNTVNVDRRTLFGNPVVVNERCTPKQAVSAYRQLLTVSQSKILDIIKYEDGEYATFPGLGMIIWRQAVRKRLPDLRGKNLACWCALDQPCHADVLLKLANK